LAVVATLDDAAASASDLAGGFAGSSTVSGLGFEAMEVVAKPLAGLAAGFFFFAMVTK
jgi:hypothetical protein